MYKRLQEIDAYGAEARAATILAGLSFDNSMQVWTDNKQARVNQDMLVIMGDVKGCSR